MRYEFVGEPEAEEVRRLKTNKGYMDRVINPPKFLEAQLKKIENISGRRSGCPRISRRTSSSS